MKDEDFVAYIILGIVVLWIGFVTFTCLDYLNFKGRFKLVKNTETLGVQSINA